MASLWSIAQLPEHFLLLWTSLLMGMAVPSLEMLEFLEYRLNAVAIGHFAIRHVMSWHSPPPIRVYFGDRQVMEGSATAFTNGAIEAGDPLPRAA